jgi:uncharacterized membrane protein
VNDTVTALACIDWLTAGLSRLSGVVFRPNKYQDLEGNVRMVEPALDYEEIISRAFDKVRQAGRGMPAIAIRQLDGLALLMTEATEDQTRVLLDQAEVIRHSAREAVPEQRDRDEVERHFERLRNGSQELSLESASLTLPRTPVQAPWTGERALPS